MPLLQTRKYKPEDTRARILDAAFSEIHLHGFRSAGMDAILSKAGVTKGALYHHFGSKVKLGYAVLDEVVADMIISNWVKTLEDAPNPLDALIHEIAHFDVTEEEMTLGCPLNNLANEMAPIDEGFRTMITGIYNRWIDTIDQGLKMSQERGQMRADVPTREVALFVVTTMEGSSSLIKNLRDPQLAATIISALVKYLEDLRS